VAVDPLKVAYFMADRAHTDEVNAEDLFNAVHKHVSSCLPLVSSSHRQPCPWTARWSRLGPAESSASLTC